MYIDYHNKQKLLYYFIDTIVEKKSNIGCIIYAGYVIIVIVAHRWNLEKTILT